MLKLYLQCYRSQLQIRSLRSLSNSGALFMARPHLAAAFDGVVEPMVQEGRFGKTIVVSTKPSLKVSQLYPPSGNEVIVRSVEQFRPICNTPCRDRRWMALGYFSAKVVRACQAQQCSFWPAKCRLGALSLNAVTEDGDSSSIVQSMNQGMHLVVIVRL